MKFARCKLVQQSRVQTQSKAREATKAAFVLNGLRRGLKPRPTKISSCQTDSSASRKMPHRIKAAGV